MGRRDKSARRQVGGGTDRRDGAGSAAPANPSFRGPAWRTHALVLGIAIVLIVLAYSNAPRGQWVYDDTRQIVANSYIQEPQYFWKALTSDVWAFKGERGKAWSNYWRPMFVGWLAMSYRIFGLDPYGWHLTNIALHILVTILGYFLLRALGLKTGAAAIAIWLFAVHPVHVESVTWVSGSPDLLLASFLFGSLLCWLRARASRSAAGHDGTAGKDGSSSGDDGGGKGGAGRGGTGSGEAAGGRGENAGAATAALAAALVLYACALLCKEVSIVFAGIVFVTEMVLLSRERRAAGRSADRGMAWLTDAARRSFFACLPFAVMAAVFMAVRVAVLGTMRITPPEAPGLGGVILSAPSVLFFYLRQVFFPVWLSASYGMRPVTQTGLGAGNFLLPLVFALALAYGAFRLIRWRAVYALALVWFFLPLAPVFDVRAFVPEDMVHDRYLYIALFGAAAFFGIAIDDIRERFSPEGVRGRPAKERGELRGVWPPSPGSSGPGPGGAGASAQTSGRGPGIVRDGGVEASASRSLPVLSWAVGLPLALVFTFMTHGYNLAWSGEIPLWERSVAVNPDTSFPHAQLGEAYRRAGRLKEARSELTRALDLNPRLTTAHIALGALAVKEGRWQEAEQNLRLVLDRFPDQTVAVQQLALAYQQQGKIDDALRLLEDGRRLMPYEAPGYTVNIAVLHRIAGRVREAQAELESLRDRLATTRDPGVLRAWWFLGELYREQGLKDRAIGAYENYLRSTEGLQDDEVKGLRVQVAKTLQEVRAGGA